MATKRSGGDWARAVARTGQEEPTAVTVSQSEPDLPTLAKSPVSTWKGGAYATPKRQSSQRKRRPKVFEESTVRYSETGGAARAQGTYDGEDDESPEVTDVENEVGLDANAAIGVITELQEELDEDAASVSGADNEAVEGDEVEVEDEEDDEDAAGTLAMPAQSERTRRPTVPSKPDIATKTMQVASRPRSNSDTDRERRLPLPPESDRDATEEDAVFQTTATSVRNEFSDVATIQKMREEEEEEDESTRTDELPLSAASSGGFDLSDVNTTDEKTGASLRFVAAIVGTVVILGAVAAMYLFKKSAPVEAAEPARIAGASTAVIAPDAMALAAATADAMEEMLFEPEDVGGPKKEPATEPTQEPATEPTQEPATEPTKEPTTEPTEEPIPAVDLAAETSDAGAGGVTLDAGVPESREGLTTKVKTRAKVAKPQPRRDRVAAVAHYKQAIGSFMRGDHGAAERGFRKALGADSSYSLSHRGLGLVYERRGSKSKAAASFRRYLRQSPRAKDAKAIRKRLANL